MPYKFKILTLAIIPTTKNSFLEVDMYELSLLWFLIQNKSMSKYELQFKEFNLPKTRSCATFIDGNSEAYQKKLNQKNGIKYPYKQISDFAKRLSEKGLVSLDVEKGIPTRIIPRPTTLAFIFFLQNFELDKSFEQFKIHHENAFPFLKCWQSITKIFGENHSRYMLSKCAYNFFNVQRVNFLIRKPIFPIEGYLENPLTYLDCLNYPESLYGKNEKMFDFLKTKEASDLKNAYIAYLAGKDVVRLSHMEQKYVQSCFPSLVSESEYQLLEDEGNTLFSQEGTKLKEILAGYKDLASFFTGVFIRDLVWSEKRQKTTKYVYNVAFIK